MSYVPPFEIIKELADFSTFKGELRISISYNEFINIVKKLLIGVVVEEEWYMTRYPDIADAIRAGAMRSARDHFVEHGYIEGRLPGPIVVDEQWYLEQNPDVAAAGRRGEEAAAHSHFERMGHREGRLPFRL